MTKRGQFIAFEGIDGSGKTTQAKMLAETLQTLGYDVVLTREPGGTKTGKKIRDLIMDSEVNTGPVVAFFLFEADRALHVPEIKSLLEQGYTVVCDRYEGSTFAYQYFAGDAGPINVLRAANDLATGGLKPDLTIVLDLGVEEAIGRIKAGRGKKDHYDEQGLDFHRRVRKGFLQQAKWPANERFWVVIDGTGSPEEVHQKVVAILEQKGIIR